jgi:mRNA interferase RelE/StbE
VLKLDLSRDALRFIQTLNPRQYRQVVGTVFRLLQNPEPQDSSALIGYPYHRVDIGEYRIIDNVADDVLKVEASFKRGKSEAGMDAYQVRTWEGWHHHMTLTLIAVWFLIKETHLGQQWTPALTLPQVRYGLNVLLLEVCCTPGIDSICRQVHRQLLRNELARFYIAVPVSVCHRGSYVETYSRANDVVENASLF